MLLIVVFLTLFTVAISGITTIPFSIGLLTLITVLFRKSWVFFLALGLGLYLDLIAIRPLGSSSLVMTIFVFTLFLYEKKFETKTTIFVFLSTFLGSILYLWLFEYKIIFLQALINAFFEVLIFRLIQNSSGKSIDQLDN
jgi:hypothetical protein